MSDSNKEIPSEDASRGDNITPPRGDNITPPRGDNITPPRDAPPIPIPPLIPLTSSFSLSHPLTHEEVDSTAPKIKTIFEAPYHSSPFKISPFKNDIESENLGPIIQKAFEAPLKKRTTTISSISSPAKFGRLNDIMRKVSESIMSPRSYYKRESGHNYPTFKYSEGTEWTFDIEIILEKIRINSVILAREHKRQYFHLKHILQYFRLPVIILSGVNSIISVGLQAYVTQSIISVSNCLLSLSCSIIGSIELYLGIQKQMENELISNKDYYLLSIEIYKILSLSPQNRPIKAKEFLEEKYTKYVNLIDKSNLLVKRLEDKLSPIPESLKTTFLPHDVEIQTQQDGDELVSV